MWHLKLKIGIRTQNFFEVMDPDLYVVNMDLQPWSWLIGDWHHPILDCEAPFSVVISSVLLHRPSLVQKKKIFIFD